MEANDQKQALQNAVNYNEFKSVKVYEHISQDKRKTKTKFFLQVGKNTISPALYYNEMNLFILGMSRAKQLSTKN
jgi:predicted site-specific integrase-resolvase